MKGYYYRHRIVWFINDLSLSTNQEFQWIDTMRSILLVHHSTPTNKICLIENDQTVLSSSDITVFFLIYCKPTTTKMCSNYHDEGE